MAYYFHLVLISEPCSPCQIQNLKCKRSNSHQSQHRGCHRSTLKEITGDQFMSIQHLPIPHPLKEQQSPNIKQVESQKQSTELDCSIIHHGKLPACQYLQVTHGAQQSLALAHRSSQWQTKTRRKQV